MVRAIVATLLQVGRKKISIQDFQLIIDYKDCTKADFSADGCGLFLEEVKYNIPLKSVEHLI
jgi:tRNA pseudouridine38-40 synthase